MCVMRCTLLSLFQASCCPVDLRWAFRLRYGGSEIHSIASFIGGVTAQEALKLILKQFVVLNHTLVYDGVQGRAKQIRP